MPDTGEKEHDEAVRDEVLLEHAQRTLESALETLRMLTPEGWDKAYYLALGRWHTSDTASLKDARLLAMRGGPLLKPQGDYFGSSEAPRD